MTEFDSNNINICVINLKKRVDRWEKISKHLDDLKKSGNLKFNNHIYRIEGIDDKFFQRKGCMRSHLLAILMAREQKWPCVMVLEDDAILSDNIDELWSNVMIELKNEKWDVIFGATCRLRDSDCSYFSPHLLRKKNNGIFTGTHCVIYNQTGYESIIKCIEEELQFQLPYHIDMMISLKHNKNVFLAVPFLGLFNENDRSDVRVGKNISMDIVQIKEAQRFALDIIDQNSSS